MRGSAIAATIALVITGIVVADVLTHPQGTQAAGNAIASISKPTYNALLGYPS